MRLALLAAFLALPLAACAATRGANAALEAEAAQLEAARLELMRQQILGESDEKIAEAREVFEAEIEDVRDAADAQVDAVREDLVAGIGTAARTGGTALGLGPWADLLATAATTAAGVWVARDMRKKKGKDPLQRADVSTPPVTSAVAIEAPKA